MGYWGSEGGGGKGSFTPEAKSGLGKLQSKQGIGIDDIQSEIQIVTIYRTRGEFVGCGKARKRSIGRVKSTKGMLPSTAGVDNNLGAGAG